ncbi:zinc-finger-containing protein [Leisingera sp. XS_AS12]|uniref:zinc-finger-containing protein n=1 Tax=Leisingera sp. XS_AS12 TaxID=3241294 RepID=UPI003511AF2A
MIFLMIRRVMKVWNPDMSGPGWPPGFHCLECGAKEVARVTGKEVYPGRPDLHDLPMHLCSCGAYCGCHPGTDVPLGYPSGAETRRARMLLHKHMIEPISLQAGRKKRNKVRTALYRFLSSAMGLPRELTHTGMFSVEQCREAWRHLRGVSANDLLEGRWNTPSPTAAEASPNLEI